MSERRLPLKRDLTLVYASSIAIATATAIVSIAGILRGSTLYPASQAASSAGNDAFNLAVVLPLLLLSMGLARRGRLIGLLAWPGLLFYLLYIYVFYAIGLPVNALFLPYVLVAVLCAYTVLGLLAGIDDAAVRQLLAGRVPRGASSPASPSSARRCSSAGPCCGGA